MSSPPQPLDHLLLTVIQDHKSQALAWMKDEPGSWGFLAGKAVLACRESKGGSLTDQERRMVWHRMWLLLSELKEKSFGQTD